MNPTFPLKNIDFSRVKAVRDVKSPVINTFEWQISQNEFAMQVKGVGNFYVGNGDKVEYAPEPGSDPEWINIYLNGYVLAALMHQRKIINFHASSFIYNQKGVMILGETGAGKSSLTAAFTLMGGGFLSDDFTPVVFNDKKPLIWPVYKKIKLRENTIRQLEVSEEKIRKKEDVTGKYFLDVKKADIENHPLHLIIKIETGNNHELVFTEPGLSEKFSLLRSEICSWEMLSGMPETEESYFLQLINIVENTGFVKVTRPGIFDIKTLHKAIAGYISNHF